MRIHLEGFWACSQQVGQMTSFGSKPRRPVGDIVENLDHGISQSTCTPEETNPYAEERNGSSASVSPSTLEDTYFSKLESEIPNNSPQLLPICEPSPGNPGPEVLQKLETATDDHEVQISVAPPEKWSDPDLESDNMEDGEISSLGESDDVVAEATAKNQSGWQHNPKGCKRPLEEDPSISTKRKRLDVSDNASIYCAESTHNQSLNPSRLSTSHAGYISKSDPDPGRCSYNCSKLSEPSLSGHQYVSTQQTLSTDASLDDIILSCGSSEADTSPSEDSSLVPLLRSIIEAQRKKTTELEGENNVLKSLFAKTLSEKNQALEMLRKSNQTLKKEINSSLARADELKTLKAQLVEKDDQIKNLRTDTCIIRDSVSRMGRTFVKIQEIESEASRRSGAEEDSRVGNSSKQESNKNGKSKSGTEVEVDKVPRNFSKGIQDQVGQQREKRKTSPPPGKSSSKRILTLEETYIMNKLADLHKWKYSIRDIRWIGGEYKCPECETGKKSLEAVAAHARDKHVWKLGSGVGYNNRERRSD